MMWVARGESIEVVQWWFIRTAEHQWLEPWRLVYHGCFELVFESHKKHSCRFGIIYGDFLFYVENGILGVLIRIAAMKRF